MVLFGFMESKMAITATINTDKRPVMTNSLSLASRLKKARYKSSVMALAVTRSCDEMELIIAAKIADSKKPVISGWNKILEKIMKNIECKTGGRGYPFLPFYISS